jgi:hypothetical protein
MNNAPFNESSQKALDLLAAMDPHDQKQFGYQVGELVGQFLEGCALTTIDEAFSNMSQTARDSIVADAIHWARPSVIRTEIQSQDLAPWILEDIFCKSFEARIAALDPNIDMIDPWKKFMKNLSGNISQADREALAQILLGE